MLSEQDKINNYAWWETDGDRHILMFKAGKGQAPGEVARIYRGKDGNWKGYIWPLGHYEYQLGSKDEDVSAIRRLAEVAVVGQWNIENNRYKDMLEKFTSQEGAE